MDIYTSLIPDIRRYIIDPYIGLDSIQSDVVKVRDDPELFIEDVHYQHPEMCSIVAARDSAMIRYMNEPTPEILLKAVEANGMGLQFVREDLQTREICRAAVHENSTAIIFVRSDYVPDVVIHKRYKKRLALGMDISSLYNIM